MMTTKDASFSDGVYVPCIYHMPGGVIVGDSGLCCRVPGQCVTSNVRAQLLPIVCCYQNKEKEQEEDGEEEEEEEAEEAEEEQNGQAIKRKLKKEWILISTSPRVSTKRSQWTYEIRSTTGNTLQ